MATAAPFRPNPNEDILDLLNIGRKRQRIHGRGRRPEKKRPNKVKPTPKPDKGDDAGEDPDTTESSTTAEPQTKKPQIEEGSSELTNPDTSDDGTNLSADNDDFSCELTSSQHVAFIQANLELLQNKCDEFHACTEELYKAENFHRILAGENIQLSNMCGLMYANGGGRYTTLNEKCSRNERKAIRQDIGRQLTKSLVNPPDDDTKTSWQTLDQCLKDNALPSEQQIDTMCRMKKNTTFLCNDYDVDHTVEDFTNHEMEHLYCTCNAIKAQVEGAKSGSSSSIPKPVRIGIVSGVIGLVIILIIAVIFLCFRHRKMKRKLSKHQSMHYIPPTGGEASGIYQEIGDPSQALEALRRARDQGNMPAHYQLLGQAPALPERYVKGFTGSRPNLAGSREDIPEYLEPMADPFNDNKTTAHVNDAYNASQTSRDGNVPGQGDNQYDLARNPDSDDAGVKPPVNIAHYDSINMGPNIADEDGGYSSLGRKQIERKPNTRAERIGEVSEETKPLNQISEHGEVDDGGPVESQYFVLERESSHGSPERQALTTMPL